MKHILSAALILSGFTAFSQQENKLSTESPYEMKNSAKEENKSKVMEIRKVEKLPADSKKFTVLPGTTKTEGKQEEEIKNKK